MARALNTRRYHHRFVHKLAILTLMLLPWAAVAVHSQGFMVQPMRIDISGRAGQTLRVPLELRNTSGDQARLLEIRTTHLGQKPNGQWGIAAEDPATAAGFSVSALDWLELAEERVNIDPLSAGEVDLSIRVPYGAGGTYVAGVLVDSPPPPGQAGIGVRMRFIIPVIVEIVGRPVRRQVSISNVEMRYTSTDGNGPKSTYVMLGITNEGRTFPRIRGTVQVEVWSNGRWRHVTRVEYRELGIMPGVRLSLPEDLQRRLPSGKYRLRADLRVDGRRTPPLTRELAFEGDPEADLLAYDQVLTLSPEMLTLDVAPGATRTNIVSITNPSDEAISVSAAALTPQGLQGVAMGDVVGETLSAAPWLQIRPSEFTLRPNGRQNVRVISRIPREGVKHGHYYALLQLETWYQDGQSAGETTSKAHLVNAAVSSSPAGTIERVLLSEVDAEAGEYAVSGRFINVGNVHLKPAVRAQVLDPRGFERLGTELSGERGYLLPLENRDFGGKLDLSRLGDGYYALQLSAEYAEEETTSRRLPIRVERTAAGELSVRILSNSEDEHRNPAVEPQRE